MALEHPDDYERGMMVALTFKDERSDFVVDLCNYTIDLFYCLRRYATPMVLALLCSMDSAMTLVDVVLTALFDGTRELFSCQGPYNDLIVDLIGALQKNRT